MSDLGIGVVYLCKTCCCIRDAEVTPDGSHFRSHAKRDPREQLVDDEFMARNYHQDASGHFHSEPTPTSSMLLPPRQLSDTSNKSKLGEGEKSSEQVMPEVKAPPMMHAASTSTEAATLTSKEENDEETPLPLPNLPGGG
ncbi:hypothetical protein NLJ89_g2014 [Agrocybe chaxingu]|uniref:Uncharacterized protein n=1 Tax=Agrocybe chaxingu TaxID=84603 RepID=A0A9W8K6N7_9AGAR|nr:hypothetical protein NLJ89_g2014 [Agrocybe chaxingu]